MNVSELICNLQIPEPASDRQSCFAFSLHKAGSTLLYDMLHDLAPHAALAYFSLPNRLVDIDVPEHKVPREVGKIFRANGFLYAGFRYFPKIYDIANLDKCKKVLLVRHPLDILVSLYFSVLRSHVIPESGLGHVKEVFKHRRKNSSLLDINQFAASNAETVGIEFVSYMELLSHENLKIYRYEDIIYEKERFLYSICEHFDIAAPDEVITEIASKYDLFPDREDANKHVRQVHPNNYRKHLSRNVIQYLLDYFRIILEAYGYAPSRMVAQLVMQGELERLEYVLRKGFYSADAKTIDHLQASVATLAAQVQLLSEKMKK